MPYTKTCRGGGWQPLKKVQGKKQPSCIAIIVALIVSVVVGSICFVSSAFADNTDAKTASTQAKLVATFDEDGTITIPNATIKNDTDYVVTIDEVSITSDYDFVKDWTSDAKGKTIQPGESLNVSWSATSTVPASFDGTDEVHVGTITYTYSYDTQDKKALPDNVSIEGTYTYTGSAIEPTIKGLDGLEEGKDYKVEYKNNTDAGTATVVITGIGDYNGTKELTFTIKKALITVSGITANEKVYDGNTDATLSCTNAQLAGLVAGESLSVTATGTFDDTDDKGKDVGTNKTVNISDLTLTGDDNVLANYELATTGQQETTTANITAKPVGITWGSTTFTYNTEDQAPTATVNKDDIITGDTVDTSLTIKKDGKEVSTSINAGSYTATASLANSNYVISASSTASVNFSIEPLDLSDASVNAKVTVDPAVAAYDQSKSYTATVKQVTVTIEGQTVELVAGTDYTVNTSEADRTKSEVGTHSVEVAGLNNFKSTATGSWKIINSSEVLTIVYHGNGAKTAAGEDTYKQYCEASTAGALESNEFTAPEGKTFGFWTAKETADASTSTCVDEHAFDKSGDGIITSTAGGTTIDLYAHWVDSSAGSYWMAPSKKIVTSNNGGTENENYTNPETGISRKQADIDSDVAKLKASDTDTFSAWNTLMDNDAYHLYTIWNYDEVVSYECRFVEFRIIQVGAHDADGSAVTFMSTYSLPTAQQMNSTDTNAGGWYASAMRTSVFGENGYVQTGLSGLKDAAIAVDKVTAYRASISDNWSSTDEKSTTSDKFWALSHMEVYNSGSSYYNEDEGIQYAWLTGKNISAGSVWDPTFNGAIGQLSYTRDIENPAGATAGKDYGWWWLRSPTIEDPGSKTDGTIFGAVKTGGYQGSGKASVYYGIVPAFCM